MRIYVYAALVAAVAGGLWFAYSLGQDAGEADERQKWQSEYLALQNELKAEREREQELVIEVQERAAEREVVYRDRVKVVEKSTGECMDRNIPDDVDRVLADAEGIREGSAGRGPDATDDQTGTPGPDVQGGDKSVPAVPGRDRQRQ